MRPRSGMPVDLAPNPKPVLFTYCYFAGDGGGPKGPTHEVDAKNLGHAMQKIAAALGDDDQSVHVWKSGT